MSASRGARRKDRGLVASRARRLARRRRVILGVGLSLGGLVIAFWMQRGDTAVAIERTPNQNVLLITIDTLRADALGMRGRPSLTPNLDDLAREGIRFDFAHAHAVVTLPSHASILTGLLPFEHGIRDNSGFRLTPETPTLATWLKAEGFATGAFVSAFVLDARFGLDVGFDIYDDSFGQSRGPIEFSMAERAATDTVAAATEWIRGRHGRWFAWVHLFDPHAPYRPPPPFDREFAARPYDGEVAYTDRALAPLLRFVAEGEHPTLVVVTSDHGEALGDHGEVTHGLFAYESTLRVPLILAQRGAGSRSSSARAVVRSRPAAHVDIVPTILGALQMDELPGLPGRDLLQTSRTGQGDDERTLYFEALSASLDRGWAPLRGLLAGREKYIDLPLPERYDLATDPAEEHNLIGQSEERRRTLQARLDAFGAPAPSARLVESRDARARLQALGYFSGQAVPKVQYSEQDDPKRLIEVDQLIHRGIDLYERGRAREALEVYRQILSRRPGMSVVQSHLAFIYWRLGEIQAAVDTLVEAIEDEAQDDSLRAQLGIYLAESGSAPEAIALLEGGAAPDPLDIDILNALGIACARAGQVERALSVFGRVLELDAANAIALQNMGSTELTRGNLDAAREAFETALRTDARLPQAHTGLGVVARKQGRRAEAIEHWKRAIDLDASQYDALYNLVTVLVEGGDVSAAHPYLEQFVHTAPASLYAEEIRQLSRLLRAAQRRQP